MHKITLDKQQITPSKIVCIGRNYVDHIKELDNDMPSEPVIFLKPNSAISDSLNSNEIDEIHYEGEISFMIQSGAIVGVGFGLDLTKRALQTQLKTNGLPWERAKAFDGSAVFSEFVNLDHDVTTLRLELWINGELKQSGGYDFMLYKPNDVYKEISSFMTLEDGDIIMTGTPKGVGEINIGDSFLGKILSKDKLLVERSWIVK